MAVSTKTANDIQLDLAYRLGESSIPSSTSEANRRLSWIKEAVNIVVGGERLYWFMQLRTTDAVIADKEDYAYPPNYRKMISLRVDGYEYESVEKDEVYEKFEQPNSPVPILPAYLARSWYDLDEKFWLVPIPSAAPTAIAITSITQSGGTATVTSTAAHGYKINDYVTIAGADQAGYNIKAIILTVPSTTTYTYAVNSATVSPATGTLTATKDNIELWYYQYPDTSSFTSASSIYIPDMYTNVITSYAEGRYWSSAHKRAKSADGFAEHETMIQKINAEQWRRSFPTY